MHINFEHFISSHVQSDTNRVEEYNMYANLVKKSHIKERIAPAECWKDSGNARSKVTRSVCVLNVAILV